MVPGTVHAALVVFFAWLVQLAFEALGLNLGNETYQAIAEFVVAYILSLVGLGIFNRVSPARLTALGDVGYKPPFT